MRICKPGRYSPVRSWRWNMTSKKKSVSLFQRCRKRFLDTVGSVPSTVLAGAAGAAGAAIITLGIPAAVTGVMAATQKEELVAVFSEPADEASAANSCGGGNLALAGGLGQLRQTHPRPHEKQGQIWTRTKAGHHRVATVDDESRVDPGADYGVQ